MTDDNVGYPIHEITVAQLRRLLDNLRDDDVLIPNDIMNLAIYRGREYAGYVDCLQGNQHVELWKE
jgi:hypothetical protein